MALGIIAAGGLTSNYLPAENVVQAEIPAYAKWSRLAIKETQAKYPHAEIIDYLHIGSRSKKDLTVEKFRLWLRDGSREFGVLVNITYSPETEKLINIDFQELHFW